MSFQIVSKPIPSLDMWVYFFWPHRGCLFVWFHNPVGHNEDVVSAWGGKGGGGGGGGGVVFVTSHIR